MACSTTSAGARSRWMSSRPDDRMRSSKPNAKDPASRRLHERIPSAICAAHALILPRLRSTAAALHVLWCKTGRRDQERPCGAFRPAPTRDGVLELNAWRAHTVRCSKYAAAMMRMLPTWSRSSFTAFYLYPIVLPPRSERRKRAFGQTAAPGAHGDGRFVLSDSWRLAPGAEADADLGSVISPHSTG
jgi:hypothetical protein